MLDLQAGVHLHEVEVAVGVEQHLDGAGVGVAGPADDIGDQRQDAFAFGLWQPRARGLLEHLLVPALQRALALAEVHALPEPVGDDLDLDVPSADDALLHVQAPVAEAGERLDTRLAEGGLELVFAAHAAHAAATAARDRLEQERKADVLGGSPGGIDVGDRAVASRDHRHAERSHGVTGYGFVAEARDELGTRTDERESRRGTAQGERGVLGKEPPAGMHRCTVVLQRNLEQRVLVEVGLRRACRAERDDHVDVFEPGLVTIGSRRHGDGLHTEALAGPRDAGRDLASVRDEQATEHGGGV